jgi:hypothetical protein
MESDSWNVRFKDIDPGILQIPWSDISLLW